MPEELMISEPVSVTEKASGQDVPTSDEKTIHVIDTDTLDGSIDLGEVYGSLAQQYPHTFGPEGTTPILHLMGTDSGESKYGIDDAAVRKWALEQLEKDNSENRSHIPGKFRKFSQILRRKLTSPKSTVQNVEEVNLNQFVKFDNEKGLVLDKEELAKYRAQRSKNG